MNRRAIHTIALGRASAGHTIEDKLKAAASVGFKGVELVFEDVEAEAQRDLDPMHRPARQDILDAAGRIGKIASRLGLEIRSLQPFEQFEGLVDREAYKRRIEDAELWFAVAHAAHARVIQVPATFLPESQLSPDIVQHIRDLRELAIIGTTFNPPIGVMYEALSWSYLVNTWQKADAVVRQVDMPNFWLCHDIFHVASLLYADYFDATGVQRSLPGWRQSLKELALSDSSKVFVCQLTDSYRLNPKFPENPLWESDEAHHYLTVSKCCRPLPGKGYFPCKEFVDALLETGYDGWFSVETFVPDYSERGQGVPRRLAQEAWDCMNEFVPCK